jgi:hypothetical protein
MGLDGPSLGGVPLWRARALLKPWWDAGACVAGLLHAIGHHPDRPGDRRGAVDRGASDPLRVIGYRLKPWQGRLSDLPAVVVGHVGDYRSRQAASIATRSADQPPQLSSTDANSLDARLAARAAVERHLRSLAERRRQSK